MSEPTQSVRAYNIKRAREAWQLKMNSVEIDAIAKKLSTTESTINDIFKYTNFAYYSMVTQEISYYDTKLMMLQKVANESKKLQIVNDSMEYKRNFFFNILKATATLIFFIIII